MRLLIVLLAIALGLPLPVMAGDQGGDVSIGAWIDRSRDGLRQAHETGPVPVPPPILERQVPGSDSWQWVDAQPALMPDGRWQWPLLPPGRYRAAVWTPPEYLLTTPDVGTDDAIDSDFVSDGAVMGFFLFDLAGAPVHADVGYLDQTGDVSIGAWVDRSRDGLRQLSESGPFPTFLPILERMTPGSTTWQWVDAPAVQLPDGRWWWTRLLPGSYRATVLTPPDYLLTAPDVGTDEALDSDFVGDGTPLGFFTFTIAGAPVHADVGYLDQTGDFSYGAWIDRSRDGLRQMDENGPLEVFPPNLEHQVPGSTTWHLVGVSPVQLPDGRWWWTRLSPGTYRAVVLTPPDYLLTAHDVGTDEALDSDFVSDGTPLGFFTFTIAGAPVHADAGYLDQTGDFSYGAWIDRSRDGLRQMSETGPFEVFPPNLERQVPGSTTWHLVGVSPVQLPDGRWWWTRLSPGSYRAVVLTPPDYVLTAHDVGTDEALDSDFVSDGTPLGFFTFTIAGAPVHADAGFAPPAPSHVGGLHAEFFDFWSSLSLIPDLSRRIPQVVRSDAQIAYASTSGSWSGLPSSMTDTFASRHSGFLKIDVPGTYTLFLSSDDGSRLYLDESLRIDNNGLHGMVERSVTLTLSAGYHPLRVEFFENGGGAGLLFSWSGPGIAKTLVPASALWHQPTAVAGLPAPWSSTDIGAIGIGGAAVADSDGDTFIVNGSGSDIWNNADAFQFVHQPLSMNGSLIARVTSLDNTNAWAKAGVMVRASTAANSAHAMMVLTPANGASFQYRTATGGSSGSATSAGKAAPHWVKVSRNGTSVSGWISSDGITWSQVGATITVPLGATPRIGLAVTAHDNTRITTAVFEQVVFVPAAGG